MKSNTTLCTVPFLKFAIRASAPSISSSLIAMLKSSLGPLLAESLWLKVEKLNFRENLNINKTINNSCIKDHLKLLCFLSYSKKSEKQKQELGEASIEAVSSNLIKIRKLWLIGFFRQQFTKFNVLNVLVMTCRQFYTDTRIAYWVEYHSNSRVSRVKSTLLCVNNLISSTEASNYYLKMLGNLFLRYISFSWL